MFRARASVASAAVLASLALAGSASAADTVAVKFDQAGEHPFLVPAGVDTLSVRAIGEQGGAGERADGSLLGGGWGGDVAGTVKVIPNRTYWVEVDSGGGSPGMARYSGGRGGGASAFRQCSSQAAFCNGFGIAARSRLIVAAGGGGSAGGNTNTSGRGGNAGAAGAASEIAPHEPTLTTGGHPGTESGGGGAGLGLFGVGADGVFRMGGGGGGNGDLAYGGGGGGGGGWYGGGGGGASSYQRPIGGGGGGGGSNHVHPSVLSPVITTATIPSPVVTISWRDDVAPAPSIDTPANGDVTSAQPTLRGKSGTAMGDRPELEIAIYAGSSVANGATPVRSLKVRQEADGAWAAQPGRLAPGTYTAVVTQGDWAYNFATDTVTFRVLAETQAPTPTSAEPTQPATSPRPSAAVPAAAVRIDTKRARLSRRALNVRLKCTGPIGQRCSGRLTLTAKAGKRTITLGSAPYAVTADRTSTVRVRIRAAKLPRRVTAKAAGTARTITII